MYGGCDVRPLLPIPIHQAFGELVRAEFGTFRAPVPVKHGEVKEVIVQLLEIVLVFVIRAAGLGGTGPDPGADCGNGWDRFPGPDGLLQVEVCVVPGSQGVQN